MAESEIMQGLELAEAFSSAVYGLNYLRIYYTNTGNKELADRLFNIRMDIEKIAQKEYKKG